MEKGIRDLVNGAKLYHVWLYQAYYELSAKYKRTILGSLWITSNMIFTSLAVAIVFGSIFGRNLQEVLPYMMAGNLVGTTALFVLYEAPEMYIGSGGIIKNHAYPFTYFAFEGVSRKIILFFHNLVAFYIAMFIIGAASIPHWSIILGLPLLCIGLLTWGTLIGMLSARFRDLRFLLPNLGHLLFFMTPIYWHYELLKDNHWIADLNPLYAMVSIVRMPLLGVPPSDQNWAMAFGICALGVILWLIFFSMFRRRIPFWV